MSRCTEWWRMDPELGLRLPVIDFKNVRDVRLALANAATLESYALLQMLRREEQQDHEDGMFGHVFGAAMSRLIELNGATCEVVGSSADAAFEYGSLASIADTVFAATGWRDSRDPGDTQPSTTFGAEPPVSMAPGRRRKSASAEGGAA